MSAAPAQDTPQRFTALVLAAPRGAADPVAGGEDVSHKCLVDIAGRPMVERVVETLRSSPSVDRIAISIDDAGVIDAMPELARAATGGELTILASDATPSLSVLKAAEALGAGFPLLVTTADNPLLTTEMVEHFCAGALRTGADLAAGLAERSVIEADFPAARRTYLRFRDGRYSGCNLFALPNARGLDAIRFWVRAERHRKRPWRLILAFGPLSLVLFWLGLLTLEGAMKRASSILKLKVAAVVMPFAAAAVDVDKPEDLTLVRRILQAE